MISSFTTGTRISFHPEEFYFRWGEQVLSEGTFQQNAVRGSSQVGERSLVNSHFGGVILQGSWEESLNIYFLQYELNLATSVFFSTFREAVWVSVLLPQRQVTVPTETGFLSSSTQLKT